LRRDGPVKALREGIRRKFFSRAKSGRVGVAELAKMRMNDDARAFADCKTENRMSQKTRITSALLRYAEFRTRRRSREKIFGAACCRRSRCASSAQAGRGTYTQN